MVVNCVVGQKAKRARAAVYPESVAGKGERERIGRKRLREGQNSVHMRNKRQIRR
jgi:hypothetical protein